MALATVVIPTHDHAQTLSFSVQSALDQTVEELEIFIVGDGVGEDTHDVMIQLGKADGRVR